VLSAELGGLRGTGFNVSTGALLCDKKKITNHFLFIDIKIIKTFLIKAISIVTYY
jgi:hypothetical protein